MGAMIDQRSAPIVLVVDDDEVMRRLLSRVLTRRGYVVEEAGDGMQALAAYQRVRPDIVLLDVMMAGMDGFETCARLRALPGGDSTPVLMVTALGDLESIERAFEAGATDYIIKSLNLDVVCYRVRNTLRARLAEDALERERNFVSAVIDGAGALIMVLDREGRIVRFNPTCERTTGYSFDEVAGKCVWDLIQVPEVAEHVRAIFERVRADQVSSQYESEWLTKNGKKRLIAWSNTALVDGDGSVEYVISTGVDITDHHRLEEQMRHQDRLAALGQLAGGIAHDFNNILMNIILSSQMLLDEDGLPPDLAPDLEGIFEDAQEAAHLVEQILDFSRRSHFEAHPVDLQAFICKVADMLRRTMPENIGISFDVGQGECVVDADPTRLRQVLLNLAANARDAMPEGGELCIGLSRVELAPEGTPPLISPPPAGGKEGGGPPAGGKEGGQWICLSISDTGTGMPAEVKSHLFEPFFTTKPRGQGTGLGLAQVHGIVTQHGGDIRVETEIGRGTTFRIYLPCYELQEVEEVEEIPQEEALPLRSNGRKETILLVEDEEKLRRLARRALEGLGYRVLTAVNGRDALQVYHSAEGVDLVLTDMVMPEMGGRDLMRELRKVNPHLKGLVITGYALEDDLRALREEGILEVVQKPFDIDVLGDVVRQVLDSD